MNIVFFHLGINTTEPDLLCRSAKKSFQGKDLTLTQITDFDTPKVKSVDKVYRTNTATSENIMLSRVLSYREYLNANPIPTIFLDTDMLILNSFSIDFSKGPVLCERSYSINSQIKTSFHGEENIFSEHAGKTFGELYPFVGCFFGDTNTLFLDKVISIYQSLDIKYHRWWGDQVALREASKNSVFSTISEDIVAHNPFSFEGETEGLIALHFKGAEAKKIQESIFFDLYPDLLQYPENKFSYRSNPDKRGYELPAIVNPYFKDYLIGSARSEIEEINPTEIDFGLRADIICKIMALLSAKLNLLPKNVGLRSYKKCLFALNGCSGLDSPDKLDLQDYLKTFDSLFLQISRTRSFDPKISIIPLSCDCVPIDGSHRISTAICLGLNIPAIKLPVKKVPKLPFDQLIDRFGLNKFEMLLATRTYLRYQSKCRIFILFSKRNNSKDAKVLNIIENYFRVDTRIDLKLVDANHIKNLIHTLYPGCDWLGNDLNGFKGLRWKAANTCQENGYISFLIVTPHQISKKFSNSALKDLKELCRSVYGNGFHSIHSTDTLEENVFLFDNFIGKSFFNNSNFVVPLEAKTDLLSSQQKEFLEQLSCLDLSRRERIVISGGLVLALLGLRATNDIDLITDIKLGSEVNSHNKYVEKYGQCGSYLEIISNPAETFWLMYKGKAIRILGLDRLIAMKDHKFKSSRDKKHSLDIAMINAMRSAR